MVILSVTVVQVHALVERIAAGQTNPFLIFGGSHAGELPELPGKVVGGMITQSAGCIFQRLIVLPQILSGIGDPHAAEIVDGRIACIFPEYALEMGTAYGEFLAEHLDRQLVSNMVLEVIHDPVEEDPRQVAFGARIPLFLQAGAERAGCPCLSHDLPRQETVPGSADRDR